ncbi:MAG: hypothetical protein HN576_17520 [Bacteriovoracaceae bacterium]|jgi:hypothetical protein|nr:hypothetical protein [Bacteriovoracaceae bacterium]
MMETLKIAWVGEESKFSQILIKKLQESMDTKKIVCDFINLETRNLKLIFSKFPDIFYELIFVDFSQDGNYKVDLCKIIQKYEYLNQSKIIGILDESHDSILYTDFLTLPVDLYTVKKVDAEEIIEDINAISNDYKLENTYFSTPGFDEVLWFQIPCTANYKNGKFKIYSPITGTSNTASFKELLKAKQKENEFEYDDKIKEWIEAKETDVSLSYKVDSDTEINLNGSDFIKSDDHNKVKLDKNNIKKLGKNIELFQISNDHRKRVVVFDQFLSLFEECWTKNSLNNKINMFNFPHITQNFSIINSIEPDLILFRNMSTDSKENSKRIQNLIDILTSKEGHKPYLVIFNQTEELTSTYENLLTIPFDMNISFINKILKLFETGKSIFPKEREIKFDDNIHYWKNSNLKNVVYVNMPAYVEKISEKVVKIKLPFELEDDLMVYENSKLGGVFMRLFKDKEDSDPSTISGLIFSESEEKKMNIRKFTNYINFKPKTYEQQKEFNAFLELKNKILQARLAREKKEKKKKKRGEINSGEENAEDNAY